MCIIDFLHSHKDKIIDAFIASIPALLVAALVFYFTYKKEERRLRLKELKNRDNKISNLKSEIILTCEKYFRFALLHEVYGLRANIFQIKTFFDNNKGDSIFHELFINKSYDYEGMQQIADAELRKQLADLFLYLNDAEQKFLEDTMTKLYLCSIEIPAINWTEGVSSLKNQMNKLMEALMKSPNRMAQNSFGKPLNEIKKFLNPKAYDDDSI